MTTAITATPLPDLAAVLLDVTGAPAGPLTITRSDANGIHEVRQSPGQETASGALVVIDYEPALVGDVIYIADGASDTTTVGATKPMLAVAANPARAATLELVYDISENADGTGVVHRVIDRADPVIITGPLGTRTGSVTVWCATYDDARAIRETVAKTGDVVLFRQPTYAGMDWWAVLDRVSVSHFPELYTDPATGLATTMWSAVLTYTETIAPEGPLLSAAGWTVQDVADNYATVAVVTATFSTVRDLAVGP